MNGEAEFPLESAVAEAVRESNRLGLAANRAAVFAVLAGRGMDVADETAAQRIDAVLGTHQGIASFASLSGETLYHDPEVLSATYARIVDRKAAPLALMAEEVRLNSRDYPRPVPVELFEAPPFDLSPEEIRQALQGMAGSAEYEDITFTATSTGAVYLFSLLHLKRGYAEFLAERAENMVLNP